MIIVILSGVFRSFKANIFGMKTVFPCFCREAIEALAAKREEDVEEMREELEKKMSCVRIRLEEELENKKKVRNDLIKY